jgi:hypothetical protein
VGADVRFGVIHVVWQASPLSPVHVELEVGSFFSTVCGRCTLLLSFFFDALLASFFNGFSGGIIGVVCGKSLSGHQSHCTPRGQYRERRFFQDQAALRARRRLGLE